MRSILLDKSVEICYNVITLTCELRLLWHTVTVLASSLPEKA